MAEPTLPRTTLWRAARVLLRYALVLAAMFPLAFVAAFFWSAVVEKGLLDWVLPGEDPMRLTSFTLGWVGAHMFWWAAR